MDYEKYHNEVKDLIDSGLAVTTSAKMVCQRHGIKYNESIGRRYRYRFADKKEEGDFLVARKRKTKKSKSYIIIWAQNGTPLHIRFWENLLAYAEYKGAEIHVIAGRYSNPTSVFQDRSEDKWDSKVARYLDANRHIIEDIEILSDIKVQPTASMPLSGMEGVTSWRSCIIGHPRLHYKQLAVLADSPEKRLLTTGACTLPNYTDSKAGKKGEFHHTFGFAIIDRDGVRQVSADSKGDFCDYDVKVVDGKIDWAKASTAVFGDLHFGEHDPEALAKQIEVARHMNCDYVVLHDVFDGKSVNHHERGNPFAVFGCLEDEVNKITRWINSYSDLQFVIVRSNHDEWLDRYIDEVDWRKFRNKEYMIDIISERIRKGNNWKGAIPYLMEKECKNVICLDSDESFMVQDVELGIHGHIGINGGRGTGTSFKKLSQKTITGHTHSPLLIDGHMCVGTTTKLRLGYNKGASSWRHSMAIIHENGKRQLIHL